MPEHHEHQPTHHETERPADWLPSGIEQTEFLKKDREWQGIEDRIGQPRITQNVYYPEVIQWIQATYHDNPDLFSYFEAGCGHGNDLRAIRRELGARGHFLGVDMSQAEILHGLEHYHDAADTRELFAQGDLRDLRQINVWNPTTHDYSQPRQLRDGEFDLIYFEAVLHGLGYGQKTYHDKKAAAQQMLSELSRLCKPGGTFFGRANAFGPGLTHEQQLQLMRSLNDWRFIPPADELETMLRDAGFTNLKTSATIHEKASEEQKRENVVRFSFMAKR